MWHVWGKGEVHTGFSWGEGGLRERELGRPKFRREGNIKVGLQDVVWRSME
jgi:hypothetical protein